MPYHALSCTTTLQADPTVQSGPTAGTVGTDVTITVTIAPPNTYGLRKWGKRCAGLPLQFLVGTSQDQPK